MKKIVFLWAQILCLAGAFAQPPRGPVGVPHPTLESSPTGGTAQQGGVLPIQDSPAQRRIELRAILQSPQNALEQPATERRLSPEERAELREQVRQQYQRRPHNTDKP